jgi:hypothetical protein
MFTVDKLSVRKPSPPRLNKVVGETHPYMLKALGDRAFCEGINRFIFHTTTHQPWLNVLPGMTMGP